MEKEIERLKQIIDGSRNIVLFTGAGISVPSGIPDFRSEGGLYKTSSGGSYPAEYMLSHTFFMQNPKEFYRFYKENMLYPDAEPNAAHLYFSDLEKHGKLKSVITQNIDGLHQKAGSKNVFELHGSVLRNYCMRCGKKYGLDYVLSSDGAPVCGECGGRVRPDVVLYEESLNEKVLTAALEAVQNAEVLIVVGTSLVVYPAAGLVNYFGGRELVLINKSKTSYDSRATLILNSDVSEVCTELT